MASRMAQNAWPNEIWASMDFVQQLDKERGCFTSDDFTREEVELKGIGPYWLANLKASITAKKIAERKLLGRKLAA